MVNVMVTLSAIVIDKRVLYRYSVHLAERCPSWLKEHDWKSCVLFIAVPRVRIPLSPPHHCFRHSDDSRLLKNVEFWPRRNIFQRFRFLLNLAR